MPIDLDKKEENNPPLPPAESKDTTAENEAAIKRAAEKVREDSLLGVNARNAIVLKTVATELAEVASKLTAVVAKDGADPADVAKLEMAKSRLDSLQPMP